MPPGRDSDFRVDVMQGSWIRNDDLKQNGRIRLKPTDRLGDLAGSNVPDLGAVR